MRDKLIELLDGFISYEYNTEELVDTLIANGVTVQEWINFDEVKPEHGQSVWGITTEGKMEVHYFDASWQHCLCQYGGNVKTFNITHWMPLPQPPKGE